MRKYLLPESAQDEASMIFRGPYEDSCGRCRRTRASSRDRRSNLK